jgi:hypothetical protein
MHSNKNTHLPQQVGMAIAWLLVRAFLLLGFGGFPALQAIGLPL